MAVAGGRKGDDCSGRALRAGLGAACAAAGLARAEGAGGVPGGARWAFVDGAWRDALAALPDGAAPLERAVEFDSPDYRRLLDAEATGGAALPPAACRLSDPAWLFYTSGTTGRPKGVVISHGNLAAMSRCFLSDVEAVAPGDALLHPAPLSHGSGLYVLPHVLPARST